MPTVEKNGGVFQQWRAARAQRAAGSDACAADAETCHATTLCQLRPGQCGQVEALCCQMRERLRLLEMGVTPGTEVKVLRTAAFGGPIEVQVRGYQLSLRREEAACIYLA